MSDIKSSKKNYKSVNFKVDGTHCGSCESIIKRTVKKLKGVESIEFDLKSETASVYYNESILSLDEIFDAISNKGYSPYFEKEKSKYEKIFNNIIGITILLIGVLFISKLSHNFSIPQINSTAGYGIIFLIGLVTGFHCVTMCGAFVLSYTSENAKKGLSNNVSHILYGVGKTLSYTILGGLFGLIGAAVTFTPALRAWAAIIAGIFLILFGLKTLNLFPILRHLNIRTPKFVTNFLFKITGKKLHSSPFLIGILNGFMLACGPLQAMYITAASTGSFIQGSLLLFFFGLGTLPVLLGFGYLVNIISKQMTHKLLKYSGILVIVLGVIMVNNGLILSGNGTDLGSIVTDIKSDDIVNSNNQNSEIIDERFSKVSADGSYQTINMDVTYAGWSPDTFILQKGVPVKWVINGKEISGCNNAIQVPTYGLEFDVKAGLQTIEFTPNEEGTFRWSCWMGMIPGTFIVKDDINKDNMDAIEQEVKTEAATNANSGGSCGAATGGSCGCGGRK